MQLPHLFSPLRIGGLELRNRIAMAPMGVEIAEEDGRVREPVVRFYEARARGGVGLIVTENTAAAYPRGANSAREIALSDDACLPGLCALTEAVHAHGAAIAVQLAHHGKIGRLDIQQGRELLLPSLPRESGFPAGRLDLSPEELGLMARAAGGGPPKLRAATPEDLARLCEDFADAALRARRAGFDAVELHGAHGYIFSSFLSPASNFREDAYGGPVENRARLLCEVLRACKARAGADFPIWARIDAEEIGTPGGIRFDDAGRTAELLVEAGADAISVSAYANPLGAGFTDAPIVHREAGYADHAAGIKARVPVPVIAAGRIEPEVGERLVREGRADVIAMGRKLLADPELPGKLAADRAGEARPCIYCYVCVAQPFFDRRVRCAVNPELAREAELGDAPRTPAARRRRVLVVGGGPAGLEAARVAALRGHDVVLCEQGPRLGGALRLAALAYEPNQRLLAWLEAQVRALPIEVRLHTPVDAARVREIAAEVVLAGPGARRERPALPGADRPHVFDGDDLRRLLGGEGGQGEGPKLPWAARAATAAARAFGLLADPARLRRASRLYLPLAREVVIVGGGLVGIELAEFLVARRRRVAVLEEGGTLALEMAHPRRWRVLHELRQAGARLHTGVREVAIDDAEVRFATDAGPQREPAGTVVLATGLRPDPDALAALREAGVPVVPIGDAHQVGYLEGAIHSGFEAALEI